MSIQRLSFDNTTNSDLLKEGALRQIFDDTSKEGEVYYKTLFNDKTTDLYKVVDLQMGGLTAPGEIVEGEAIPIQKPTLGTEKTYTQRFFGTGFRMTWAMNKFNKYDLWQKNAKQLAKVMKIGKDIEIHVLLNSPTSTSLTCGVGFTSAVALASASHTGLNPNTTADNYSNIASAALGVTSLQSMRYYFATLTDAMGTHMGAKPTDLFFNPTLWFSVQELLGSANKPWEQSNTKNYLGELGLKPYEYPLLTSTTRWGVISKTDG
jgi:hypothetical protein